MKKIKVEVIGSKIREKNTTKKILQALGLKKIGQKKEFNYNDAVLGMLKKVSHLVAYEIIEEKEKKVAPKKGQKKVTKKEKKAELQREIENNDNNKNKEDKIEDQATENTKGGKNETE